MKVDRDIRKALVLVPILVILLFAGIVYLNIEQPTSAPAAEESQTAPTPTPVPIAAPNPEENIINSPGVATIADPEEKTGGTTSSSGSNSGGSTFNSGAGANTVEDTIVATENNAIIEDNGAEVDTNPINERTTIPEYPTIAAPVGIALGMMFVVSHLRKKS